MIPRHEQGYKPGQNLVGEHGTNLQKEMKRKRTADLVTRKMNPNSNEGERVWRGRRCQRKGSFLLATGVKNTWQKPALTFSRCNGQSASRQHGKWVRQDRHVTLPYSPQPYDALWPRGLGSGLPGHDECESPSQSPSERTRARERLG
jgi:hypothetical protein